MAQVVDIEDISQGYQVGLPLLMFHRVWPTSPPKGSTYIYAMVSQIATTHSEANGGWVAFNQPHIPNQNLNSKYCMIYLLIPILYLYDVYVLCVSVF